MVLFLPARCKIQLGRLPAMGLPEPDQECLQHQEDHPDLRGLGRNSDRRGGVRGRRLPVAAMIAAVTQLSQF